MNSDLTKKIIFDYFDGKATSIQRKMIEEWLIELEHKELYYQYLDEWEGQHPQYAFDKTTGLKKVYQTIEEVNTVVDFQPSRERSINLFLYIKWVAAASVILVTLWMVWRPTMKNSSVSYKQLVSATKKKTGELYERENLGPTAIVVNLPDKSSVILQPKSKISYSPKRYNKTSREVILSGEAFFEVQKDSQRPFVVYANELITKVLGTSFSIKTHQATSDIDVIVKTGRVAVFLQHDVDKNKKITGNSLNGLVLRANEQVKVSQNNYTYIISKPTFVDKEFLKLPIQRLTFNFDDAPIRDVLKNLEQAYGIQISYDHEKLAACRLTASLADEPLADKLKLICIALEATYEEVDNKIILKSNGCN